MRKANRAAQGSGTIRQRPDGRWEGRYTVGHDPGSGKQVQKSVYAATQKEVRQKLAAITTDIDSGVYLEPARMTVGQWLDVWLKDYIINVKDTTKSAYSDNVRLHIKPALGAVALQKLNAHTIQSFYNSLAVSGRVLQKGQTKTAPAGLSAKTIRNIHAILHKALKQAVLLSYIKMNPADACTLPRVERHEMRILQGDEIPAFIRAVEGHKHKALFLTMLFTGMRRGEALGLTWDCVDFDGGTILIKQQMQRERVKGGKLRFVPLKNDKHRRVTPPATVFHLLREQLRHQSEQRLLAGSLWSDRGLVFTNETGSPLDADAVYQAYKKMLSANELANIRIHDLRHTAATLMLQTGDGIKEVQTALGHHTAAFTLDVYGHVTDRMKTDSAERMEAYIQGCKG
jgi:integrase